MMEDVSPLQAQGMSMRNILNAMVKSAQISGEHISLNSMKEDRLSGREHFLHSKYQRITMIGQGRILTLQMMEVQS